jgi:RNA polymerase sigma factor (sigma-70 family)
MLHGEAAMTDGQLLESFVQHREDAALAALVHRHAGMVWGVCHRLLRNDHDAEDAFQATFLVLVRKAATIQSREKVANWLYGVAQQTAVRVRTAAVRRGVRERQVTEMPEPTVAEHNLWSDLRPLLDQELSWLPDSYRVTVVLCDLEGKTRQEVARQLGWPEGTVASRLARARAMLAMRLARRGLVVSAGSLAAMLSQGMASAAAPLSIVAAATNAASLAATGQPGSSALISAKVLALTEEVVKAMLTTKLKIGTSILFVMIVLGLGLGSLMSSASAQIQAESNKAEQPKERTGVVPKGDDATEPKERPHAVSREDDAMKKRRLEKETTEMLEALGGKARRVTLVVDGVKEPYKLVIFDSVLELNGRTFYRFSFAPAGMKILPSQRYLLVEAKRIVAIDCTE